MSISGCSKLGIELGMQKLKNMYILIKKMLTRVRYTYQPVQDVG